MNKPKILIVHNTYLNKGGEDTVVQNEIRTLRKFNYNVSYKEYNNLAFKNFKIGSLLIPLNIFFNLSVFIKTFIDVVKHKIDIVHVHNVFYTVSPSIFWAAKLAGAKTVHTVHNYRLFCLSGLFFLDGKICTHCHDTNSFKKGIQNGCFKRSRFFSGILALSTRLHRAMGSWRMKVDHYVAINPFISELLIQKGIDPGKIYLKPNYCKQFGSADYQQREDFYFFAGRLQAEKGVKHMVKAFQLLNKKLIIAGDGELSNWVMQNTSSQISFIGQQSPENMQDLYLKCKAVIFPSIWLEGMPMTIIEAQSAGAIPIVAGTQTTKNMISNNINGFLYEAENVQSLINAVNIFEKKSLEELNIISNNARLKFLRDYEEVKHLEIIEQIYN